MNNSFRPVAAYIVARVMSRFTRASSSSSVYGFIKERVQQAQEYSTRRVRINTRETRLVQIIDVLNARTQCYELTHEARYI